MAKQERRERTEQALIRAIGELILEGGVEGLGVNAVARQAGANKALIYRYFGGLPGLLRAFGASRDFWPGLEEVTEGPLKRWRLMRDEPRLVREILQAYMKGLMARPVTRKILAYEMIGRNALTIELEDVRQRWNEQLVAHLREQGVPVSAEIMEITGLLSAGLNYLAAREGIRRFGGLELGEEAALDEMFDLLEVVLRGGLGPLLGTSQGGEGPG